MLWGTSFHCCYRDGGFAPTKTPRGLGNGAHGLRGVPSTVTTTLCVGRFDGHGLAQTTGAGGALTFGQPHLQLQERFEESEKITERLQRGFHRENYLQVGNSS